ncbi:MAG TPA: lysylphosphatidylglycerol synthase transmembrane domain-containing protein [Gaiellaceae bacterium]|nr:lysylphosphatidylglycerol synthase transmembrane domain-containing protein [Gaiellaceae bacterium]
MNRLLAWAGVLVSGVFVWLAVRDVDFGLVAKALHEARWWPVAPALAALAVGTALRALRWQALFDAETRPPLPAVTEAMLIGLLFNSILPARAGEAARIVALHRDTGTSRAEALATAVAERVYDVFALLLLLFLAVPFLPDVPWLGQAAVAAGALAAAIAAAVLALLRWRERPVAWALTRLARTRLLTAERADGVARNLVAGLTAFRSPQIALRAFALTVASWLVFALSSWLLLYGFDVGETGFGAGLLATIATSLVLVIPAAPGGVGQFEAAAILALSVFGVDRSRALSYGVVLHAVNLVPYLVAGYVALRLHTLAVRRRRMPAARGEPGT